MYEYIKTADLYESAYYLLNGARIDAIEGLPVNKDFACQITLKGEDLLSKQGLYLQGNAEVNLFQFRRAYSQVLSCLSEAKRSIKKQLSEEKRQSEKAAAHES